MSANGYIVKRELSDNGPMGSTYAFFKVDTPRPGERIYRGKFKPRTVSSGQYDAESTQVWDYVGEGEPASEIWQGEGDNSIQEF